MLYLLTPVGPAALAYSVIAPIINGLAAATFFLFYMLWKYRFLWQLGQPRSTDSGGRFFPMAIQHVFVGLYIEEVLLAALFFLARDSKGDASAIPQGALMVVLIVFTVGLLMLLPRGGVLMKWLAGVLPPYHGQLV